MNNTPQKPDNYLVWAILSTILCCWPFGIVSIVYSVKVNSEWSAGNYQAAIKNSENAKLWAMISAGGGVVAFIIGFIGGFLGAL